MEHPWWLDEHRALCAPDETLSDHRVCESPQHHFNLAKETEGLVLKANLLLFPAVPALFLFFPSLFPWIALLLSVQAAVRAVSGCSSSVSVEADGF